MNEKTTEEILNLVDSLNDDEIIKQYNECTGNKQYGSYLNPEREANTWVDTFYEKDKDVFIVIGTGRLHYHVALARKLEKGQKLFILDWKLPLIAAARSEVHALAKKANVIFRFSRSIEEMILSIFGVFDRYTTKKIKFGIIPPYQFIFPEEAQKIQEQIRNFLSVNLVRSRTFELFGMEWTTNYMRNLPHILKRGVPFKNFVNQFDGVPAVVVSAGPSLEKNVELLPQIFNKAVIIAAGSAIETLKEYGINPHFLASFDAGAGNYPHFQHLDTKQLRLIFTGDIYPRILDEFEGVLIPAESLNKPTYELYKQCGAPPLGEVLIGPSVANFALDISVRLGCNPVILIGQDLALKDGKSHAKGNYYRAEVEDLSDYIRVKGNIEDYVYTNKSWLTMLKNFEQQIKLYKQKIVINATEGGAFIEGTIVKPLREVIAEYMTSEWGIEERIRNLCEKQNGFNAEPEKIIAKVKTKLIKTKKLIEHTLPEIEKILLKLRNGSLSPKDYMRIEQIKKNEDRLLESLEYQHIIKTIIYGRILYFERYYSRLASEQPEKVELWVAEYQKILFESARDALNAFFSETKDLAGNDKRNEES